MNPIAETALITGGSTAVVAIAGLWATLASTRQTIRSQRDVAREARHQERLEQAYIALGEYLSRFGDWARSVHPFLGPIQAPEPLPPPERWHIEALVTAYGSEEVQRAVYHPVAIRMSYRYYDLGCLGARFAMQGEVRRDHSLRMLGMVG